MNLHEFQAKEVLRKYGIIVTEFAIASTLAEAEIAVEKMALDSGVVKVQIHAGGRGKAGGVRLARSRSEIFSAVTALLGMRIVNSQTGKEGVVAEKVLITPLVEYKKEFYIGAVIDRAGKRAALIASPEGGMEIEEVAQRSPEKIAKIPIGLNGKIRSYHLLELCKFMGWEGEVAKKGAKLASALAKAFVETDAELIEINPLVLTEEGELIALDAKMAIDDNGLFRQKELAAAFDARQLPRNEILAREADLAYVALEGNIGCMVNGAGLAMATMDIIHHYGGKPANFLDVGGSASKEKVAEGFKIILSDPNVKAILVNIFGGIMNCETLALGIMAAASEMDLHIPLVIRMEGTNVERARELLADSKMNFLIAEDFASAAEKVVSAAKKAG